MYELLEQDEDISEYYDESSECHEASRILIPDMNLT